MDFHRNVRAQTSSYRLVRDNQVQKKKFFTKQVNTQGKSLPKIGYEQLTKRVKYNS